MKYRAIKISFMKNKFMKNTMYAVLLVTSLFSVVVQAAESTVFNVNGMVCAFCAQGIEKKLKQLPETFAVFVDLAAKTVIVEAKPDMKVPVETVIREIKDAGYDVTGTKTVPESVDALQKKAVPQKEMHQGMHHE